MKSTEIEPVPLAATDDVPSTFSAPLESLAVVPLDPHPENPDNVKIISENRDKIRMGKLLSIMMNYCKKRMRAMPTLNNIA